MPKTIGFTWMVLIMATACGPKPTDPAGSSGTSKTLEVRYLGFVGQSLMTSDPTVCPTPACAVSPTKTLRTETRYTYSVVPNSTYTIHGTIVGRPAPLTGPAFNVAADLSFDVGLPVTTASPPPATRLGIPWASIHLNGAPFDPRGDNGAGSCGVYMFSSTPSIVINWMYTFSISEYSIIVVPGSTYCA